VPYTAVLVTLDDGPTSGSQQHPVPHRMAVPYWEKRIADDGTVVLLHVAAG
jgi:hypothetical protein